MNSKTILSATLMALLSLGLTTGLSAQERVTKPDYDKKGEVPGQAEVRGKAGFGYGEKGRIGKFNRASKLIGMNVKNQLNENLGEIEDLVVDMQSGRISYAVLATGGVLGIGEKYIAVPTSAFEHSTDGDRLVLNADKTKIDQAPGFTKDNWPDVESPAWGAYWGTSKPGAATPGERGELGELGGQTFHGKVVAMNAQARTMTLQGDLGTQVFSIDQNATLRLKDAPTAKLSDLKVGDHVSVNFRKLGEGNAIVYSIHEMGAKGGLERK